MRFIINLMLLLIISNAQSQNWKTAEGKLMSKWAKTVNPENVWKEYPRPQFERTQWKNLNGLWDYAILRTNEIQPKKFQGKILVPFSFESPLSGVGKNISPNDKMWYMKTFDLPKNWSGKKIIIHFEAVDYDSSVWLNDILLGSHKGGFDRFSFDITPYIKPNGRQKIVLSVKDGTNFSSQPRGKQQIKPSGIYYTPVSGIWQTVWLEAVSNEAHLQEVKTTSNIDEKTVTVIPITNQALVSGYSIRTSVFFNGEKVAFGEGKPSIPLTLKIDTPQLWSPDNPNLYDLKLILVNPSGAVIDQVDSYFGMRKISLGDHKGVKYLFLNNRPLFHYGTLDQGWWPDGLLTPPSDQAMKYDIEMTKKMGFNMIRKHVKIEPDRWYYYCDKLGIMVWQDMPSFNRLALKTEEEMEKTKRKDRIYNALERIHREDEDLKRSSKDATQFEFELRRMVDIHYNAPSIVIWVPFNEGWGQYDTCRITDFIKRLDPHRLVNPTSGWTLRACGDIYDIHTYDVNLTVPPTAVDRATVVGEFGGIGYPIEKNLWNPKMRNWGYQTYYNPQELLKNYIYKFNQIVEMKERNGLSAAVYTQTTDVEGEINGLMTYDRKVIKMPTETLKELHTKLYQE
ncbi:MAG: sugar-binding domain-containing protein [Bacteroidota bacterium]|nr:sugar-binding domain-containing protein [Bacteroidota bacterium]